MVDYQYKLFDCIHNESVSPESQEAQPGVFTPPAPLTKQRFPVEVIADLVLQFQLFHILLHYFLKIEY